MHMSIARNANLIHRTASPLLGNIYMCSRSKKNHDWTKNLSRNLIFSNFERVIHYEQERYWSYQNIDRCQKWARQFNRVAVHVVLQLLVIRLCCQFLNYCQPFMGLSPSSCGLQYRPQTGCNKIQGDVFTPWYIPTSSPIRFSFQVPFITVWKLRCCRWRLSSRRPDLFCL